MLKGRGELAVALMVVAVAACSPPQEKKTTPAAAPPTASALDTAGAIHVDFEPGATVMVLAGRLGEGQTARYIVGAHEGDRLMAHALSPGEDLRVAVHRLDEETSVADTAETASYWSARLPATSGYLIELHGAGEEGPFHLELEIPRRLPLGAGASRITLAGTAEAHAPLAFLADLEEGRRLDASVTSEGDAVGLTVHGVDGEPLVDWQAEAAHGFRGEVPRTQGYVFRLDPGAEASGFELSVSVE